MYLLNGRSQHLDVFHNLIKLGRRKTPLLSRGTWVKSRYIGWILA